MPKKVVVTGAAGFIGFHVSCALQARGDIVMGYDNFNHYYDPRLKEARSQILKQLGVPVLRGDLTDRSLLEKTMRDFGATHCVHLAAQAGVRHSLKAPEEYITSNIEGFLNILEVCRKGPLVPLVYASSSSVYGLNGQTPFREADRVDQQASFYGMTKRCNELMATTYHHLYGLPMTGLRFFTVYGPWGRPDMAYFSFAESILQGRPITLYAGGRLRRDFTYIDDIVSGTVAALDSCEGKGNQLYNLGNHQPVEVIEFVRLLEGILGKKAVIEEAPMQLGDVEVTYADLERSYEGLNFQPKVALAEGLQRFARWFLEWKKG